MKASETWLLDGWMGSPWRMAWMRRNIHHPFAPCRIWNYDTSGRTDLEIVAAQLSLDLQQSKDPVNLAGFSMGGLVIREALRQNPQLPVNRIACLNSPHQGTFPARCLGRAAIRQLRPGSAFLQRLNTGPCPVPFFNLWCPGDLVVIPGWNARSQQAREEICSWMPAHAWPLLSKNLHRQIRTFFDQDLSLSPSPATSNPKLQPA